MKNCLISNLIKFLCIFSLISCGEGIVITETTKISKNSETAKAMVEATLKKETMLEAIEKYMADDGVAQNSRYIGFGFNNDIDPEDGKLTVLWVTPNSPADGVLEPGDKFVSVNGVLATENNRESLSFRGQPGVPIKAVISRNGEELDIEVTRGIIDSVTEKSKILENMSSANERYWTDTSIEIQEVIESGNIVYVLAHTIGKDMDNQLPYDSYTVTRMEFNESGQIIWTGSLSEERLVLEQTGYSITR
jgi:C-terminal processing protease CtpA/Prc